MCDTCGCQSHEKPAKAEKVVDVHENLLAANNEQAAANRRHIEKMGAVGINLISSPGSGKTSLLEQTIERLGREDATRADYANQFATLTLGDGAAAAVISRSTSGRDGHRLVGGVARAGTQHHELCVGSVGDMRTDTKALLTNGLKLVVDAWSEAEADGFSWTDAERVITHQISTPYTEAFVNSVGVDPQRVPITFDQWGNVGPASIAMTLSDESKRLNGGDKVVALGVGSGLNTLLLEFEW